MESIRSEGYKENVSCLNTQDEDEDSASCLFVVSLSGSLAGCLYSESARE